MKGGCIEEPTACNRVLRQAFHSITIVEGTPKPYPNHEGCLILLTTGFELSKLLSYTPAPTSPGRVRRILSTQRLPNPIIVES